MECEIDKKGNERNLAQRSFSEDEKIEEKKLYNTIDNKSCEQLDS